MYCSYLVGFFLFELVQLAYLKMNNEGTSVITIATEEETKEPSCEELRQMWRHTKREMQQKAEAPQPRYNTRYHHEPLAYGWKSQAKPRNAMSYTKPVYGRVVYSPDKFMYRNNIPNRLRSYDQVARMVGGGGGGTTYVQKPTYFRLDYPNPRRPQPQVRVSHLGRFQELQSVLRNDRANELQMMKLKERGGGLDAASSDFPSDDSENR